MTFIFTLQHGHLPLPPLLWDVCVDIKKYAMANGPPTHHHQCRFLTVVNLNLFTFSSTVTLQNIASLPVFTSIRLPFSSSLHYFFVLPMKSFPNFVEIYVLIIFFICSTVHILVHYLFCRFSSHFVIFCFVQTLVAFTATGLGLTGIEYLAYGKHRRVMIDEFTHQLDERDKKIAKIKKDILKSTST